MAEIHTSPHLHRTVTNLKPPAPVDPRLLNRAADGPRWSNLGFWRSTRDYPEAAESLARRVGQAAGLSAGDVVVDFACGHGDSLALWVREFGVARVVGLEADHAIAAIARRRVIGWGLSDRITVRTATAESIVPEADAPGATAVVCVDAAYHFQTRDAWLTRLAAGFAPGTRLGFADLLVSRRARRGRRIVALARRAAIPEENLWVAEEVEPILSECGIVLDRLVRCGNEVLGGFARHASRSAPYWLLRPDLGGWRALGTALAIATTGRGGRLDYALISAHTQGRAAAVAA
jgi:SAM-dependent methyltransferase